MKPATEISATETNSGRCGFQLSQAHATFAFLMQGFYRVSLVKIVLNATHLHTINICKVVGVTLGGRNQTWGPLFPRQYPLKMVKISPWNMCFFYAFTTSGPNDPFRLFSHHRGQRQLRVLRLKAMQTKAFPTLDISNVEHSSCGWADSKQ